MISFIKGTIIDIQDNIITVLNNNIGLSIFSTTSNTNNLNINDNIELFTYLHVKEDGLTLYGFSNKNDLDIFKLLITVNGIGPKFAINILEALSFEAIVTAILSDDFNTLSKAKGIGKKASQKIILELKSKVSNINITSSSKLFTNINDDVIDILINFGYTKKEAIKIYEKTNPDSTLPANEQVKICLQNIN